MNKRQKVLQLEEKCTFLVAVGAPGGLLSEVTKLYVKQFKVNKTIQLRQKLATLNSFVPCQCRFNSRLYEFRLIKIETNPLCK